MKGKAWNYGDDINTDFILPGIYLELTDPKEIAKHAMEGIDREFVKKVQPGDVIIGGRNFGLGSSREQAPIALKNSGVSAVIAEGFARIFYRNTVEIDISAGKIIVNGEKELEFVPVPEFMMEILEVGGLREYIKQNRAKW